MLVAAWAVLEQILVATLVSILIWFAGNAANVKG